MHCVWTHTPTLFNYSQPEVPSLFLILDLCYRYRTEISGFMQSSIARFNCMVLYGIDIYSTMPKVYVIVFLVSKQIFSND